jgi:hypothetical protein
MGMFIYLRIPEYDRSVCAFCAATVTELASRAEEEDIDDEFEDDADDPCPQCGHRAWFYLISVTGKGLRMEIRGQESSDGIELPLSLDAVCEAALASSRFDALLETARTAEPAHVRAIAMAVVAKAAARMGALDQAWSSIREALAAIDAFTGEQLARAIPYESAVDKGVVRRQYFDAVCEAVRRIAAIDRSEGLRHLIEEIQRIAGIDSQDLPVVLAAVADAAGESGQLDILLNAMKSVPHELAGSRGVAAVAQAAARAGRDDLALAAAESIEDGPTRVQALVAVVEAASEAGRIDFALDTALGIGPRTSRAKALAIVAQTALQAGQFDRAIEGARRIDLPVDRDHVLSSLARVAAGAGRPNFALAAAGSITEALTQLQALAVVVDAVAGAGRSDPTLDSASLMGPENSRTAHLLAVVEALHAGRFDRAIEATRRIDPPLDRARVLRRVGADALEAGNQGAVTMVVEEVLKIAATYPTERTRVTFVALVNDLAGGVGRSDLVRAAAAGIEPMVWVNELSKVGQLASPPQDNPTPPAEIATDGSQQIDRFIELLENRGIQEIEIDLRQVRFLTQELYATLVKLDDQLGQPGRLRLCEVRAAPLAALRVMGWDKDFEFLSPGQVPSQNRSVTAMRTYPPCDEAAIDPCLEAVLAGAAPPSEMDPSIFRIETRVVGLLGLPTGIIVACDPDVGSTEAFSRLAPRGEFPVRLYIVHYKDGDQRIAVAALEFSEEIPDQWEQADVVSGVDAGKSCFMDRTTAERLALIRQQDPSWQDDMYREMEKTSVPTWSWAMVPIPPDSARSLACFSSGWGDGAYASYWGLRAGKVTRLVTDFELVRR